MLLEACCILSSVQCCCCRCDGVYPEFLFSFWFLVRAFAFSFLRATEGRPKRCDAGSVAFLSLFPSSSSWLTPLGVYLFPISLSMSLRSKSAPPVIAQFCFLPHPPARSPRCLTPLSASFASYSRFCLFTFPSRKSVVCSGNC